MTRRAWFAIIGSMIQVAGSHSMDAPRSAVWPRIFDPRSLMKLIPGCHELEETSPGTYAARIQIGFAGISGNYDSEVRILDQLPPESCSFLGEVTGPTGIASGRASFRLEEADGATEASYEIAGRVTGALARLPPHLLEGAIQALIQRGLSLLDRQIQEEGRESGTAENAG